MYFGNCPALRVTRLYSNPLSPCSVAQGDLPKKPKRYLSLSKSTQTLSFHTSIFVIGWISHRVERKRFR